MKKIDSILLPPNATIKDAMQIIDNGAMRIALVANPERRLIGTVTDGDIRRAILKGLTLEESVMKILFRKPTVCRPEDSREKILQLSVQKSIYQIPVVDSKGRIVGIHIVDELLKKKKLFQQSGTDGRWTRHPTQTAYQRYSETSAQSRR